MQFSPPGPVPFRAPLLAAALLLSACSATVIEPARKVADAGLAASGALVAQAKATTQAYDDLVHYTPLMDAIREGAYVAPPTVAPDGKPTTYEEIKTALRDRERTYQSLETAYNAFAKLAKAEASDEIKPSIESLAASYGKLAGSAKAVGAALPPLPDGTTDLAVRGLALFARQQQAELIKKANAAFIAVLPGLTTFAAREKLIVEPLLAASAQRRALLRRALLEGGVGDLVPTAARINAMAGLNTPATLPTASRANRRAIAGLIAYQGTLDVAEAGAVGSAYDALIQQLEKLKAAHDAVAAEEQPDTLAVIAEAQALIDAVKAFSDN